jgi:transcriptional regulator with XRE-family HTH domain
VLWRLGSMPCGQRIRNLRAALGWSQRQAANELGISKRTLIRYEHDQSRRRWLRYEPLRRLGQLESDRVEEIFAWAARTAAGPV